MASAKKVSTHTHTTIFIEVVGLPNCNFLYLLAFYLLQTIIALMLTMGAKSHLPFSSFFVYSYVHFYLGGTPIIIFFLGNSNF